MPITKNIVSDYSCPTDGTSDCRAAFISFKTEMQAAADQVILTVPAGTYQFHANGGAAANSFLFDGIPDLIVEGTGATFADNGGTGNFRMGTTGLSQNNTSHANIESVEAGATAVTLLTASQHSRFAVGRWVMISALDLQGEGFPPNHHWFEFVEISAIDTVNGVITFSTPLVGSYSADCPNYSAGGASTIYQGGPATIYALTAGWDASLEFRGLTLTQPSNQILSAGRSVKFKSVTVTEVLGLIPSLNQTWTLEDCDLSAARPECDKLISNMIVDNTSVERLTFQSSSIDHLHVTGGSIIGEMFGSPKRMTIDSACDIGTLRPGALSYGSSESFECEDSVVDALLHTGGITDKGGMGTTGVNNVYTMENGVIRAPLSPAVPTAWAVPGTRCFFGGQFDNEGIPFDVLSVTKDATHNLITTSLKGGFPTLPLTAGALWIVVHPAPLCRFVNCTGDVDVVDLSQVDARDKALYEYTKKSYTGNTLVTPAAHSVLWGTLVRANIVVSQAYTGTQGTLTLNLFGQFRAVAIEKTGLVTNWNPTINLKQAGTRVITPSSVTGAQAGDSLSAPGPIWFAGQQTPRCSADISGENAALWPIVSIEVFTTQEPRVGRLR